MVKKTKNNFESEWSNRTGSPLEHFPPGSTGLAQSEASWRTALMNVKAVTIREGNIRCVLECGFDSEVAMLLAGREKVFVSVKAPIIEDRIPPDKME